MATRLAIAKPPSWLTAIARVVTACGRRRGNSRTCRKRQSYLQRATGAYRQAQELYQRVPGFPGVATNLRRTQRSLDQITERSTDRDLDRQFVDPANAAPEPPARTSDVPKPPLERGPSDQNRVSVDRIPWL